MKQYQTYTEIASQPEAWAEALKVVQDHRPSLEKLLREPFELVIFTGCGSTYYLALAGAALFQDLTRLPARAAPASELLLNPRAILTNQPTLLVALSRSGSTTETVKAVERFKQENRGPVVVITNDPRKTLASLGDVVLAIEKGQEQSIAQTRSFASMYLATVSFAALISRQSELMDQMQELPHVGKRLIARYHDLAQQHGENLAFDRFYFLGSGILYGLACEVNLKMKEMSLTHSEPFHFLEFRHGPMSMVTPTAFVVGMLSERNRIHEKAVLNEMHNLGSKTLSLAEFEADIMFDSGIPEAGRGVLYLPVLQLMAYYRSLAKGLNPDKPTNLSSVIELAL
jgi:glutamine---fructose-6-phosphate transaminase (isomerizing)